MEGVQEERHQEYLTAATGRVGWGPDKDYPIPDGRRPTTVLPPDKVDIVGNLGNKAVLLLAGFVGQVGEECHP